MLPVSPVLEVGVEISTASSSDRRCAARDAKCAASSCAAPLVIERLPPASSVPAFIEILPALEDAGAVSPT